MESALGFDSLTADMLKIVHTEQKRKLNEKEFRNAILLWNALFYDSQGVNVVGISYPKWRKMFNNVLRRYSITQFFVLIFCHFEWYGHSGTDTKEWLYLFERQFPIEIFVKRSPQYSDYCQKVIGLDVWNDEKKLKEILDFWLEKMFKEKKA